MFLSLIRMFGFWCQILVQLAYDFGAKFQTYLSEKEICVATKGQLISKCPFGVIVSTKIPTKKFDNFCPRI